jgi:hypothetical protein
MKAVKVFAKQMFTALKHIKKLNILHGTDVPLATFL